MAEQQYTTVAEALADVPDPRARRGRRYPWPLLLLLITAALASGERHGRGIGQWVRERADVLRPQLGWTAERWPSEATVRRAVRRVDLDALERRLRRVARPPAGVATRWNGQALDGKAVRGAGTHGSPVHLLGLAQHSGIVLAQTDIARKANEITAAPGLLVGRDLRGTVTTMDALLTQRALARQIRAQGGHYLMVVKPNQPGLHAAIDTLFTRPPWSTAERAVEYRRHQTLDKGHGRLETRTLEASPTLNAVVAWPDVGQVLRRTCRRIHLGSGAIEEEVTYGITSLPWEAVSAAEVEGFWRGHWAIENKVHYPRDVTMGEDAGQAWTGQTAQALATLRNAVLNLLRGAGWTNMADALRHYGAVATRALTLIGLPPSGL